MTITAINKQHKKDASNQAIMDAVSDLDGCTATVDAMIGAFTSHTHDIFDKESAISVMLLLRRNIDDAASKIRDL